MVAIANLKLRRPQAAPIISGTAEVMPESYPVEQWLYTVVLFPSPLVTGYWSFVRS